ncbi:MAG: HEAT repeat domain-containing protein [Nitrospirota bacterium]|nr:HEAT repeat domain-containing protein [Nitrospirota bacterium]
MEKLSQLVKDKKQSDRARIKTARVLSEYGDEKALLTLCEVIKDSGERAIFRAAIARELARSKQKAKVAAFLKERIEDPKEASEVRAASAEGLGKLKMPESRNLLVRVSSDKDPKVRLAARAALLELGGEGIDRTSILISILKDFDQPGTARASAAGQLGELKDERALPALIQALQEKSSEPASPSKPEDFFASRASIRRNVPVAAARALSRLGDSKAIPPLLSIVQTPQDELRITVFEALAKLRASEAVPAARKALSDNNQRVRRWAGVLLKEVGAREALPELRQALSDPDPGVRLQAAQAIEKMQDQEGKEQLKNAFDKETVPEVREALDKALRSLK